MKIMSAGYNYNRVTANKQTTNNSLKKQPAFGAQIIHMDNAAIELMSKMIPKNEFLRLQPDMSRIKTDTCEEIFIKMFGHETPNTLRLAASTPSGKTVDDILLSSSFGKTTFTDPNRPKGVIGQVVDDFIPTIEGIQERLSVQYSKEERIQAMAERREFYTNLFGNKN